MPPLIRMFASFSMVSAICDIDNCADCINEEIGWGPLSAYGCYWCMIDNQCHPKGSPSAACFIAFDDSCISQSSMMSCDHKDEGACPAKDQHRSTHDTCDATASLMQNATKMGPDSAVPVLLQLVGKELKGGKVQDKKHSVRRRTDPEDGGSADDIDWTSPISSFRDTPEQQAHHELMVSLRADIESMGIAEDHDGEVSLHELAQMSNDIYELADADTISAAPPSGWTVSDQWPHPDLGDYPVNVAMAVYKKGTDEAVFVFKGEDLPAGMPANPSDLNDLQGLDPKAMEEQLQETIAGNPPVAPVRFAVQQIKTLQDSGVSHVLVTGHSFGGYLAEIVATTVGIAGVGFASPGPGWHAGFKGGAGSGFRNVNFEHDPIGNVLPGVFLHAQWSIYIQDYEGNHHTMQEMLASMKARPDWTNQNAACQCGERGEYGYESRVSMATVGKGKLRRKIVKHRGKSVSSNSLIQTNSELEQLEFIGDDEDEASLGDVFVRDDL